MTEQEFKINGRDADTFRRLSNPPEVYFWEGYRRGFGRHYHGEIYGTAREHAQWMMMSAHGTLDRLRHYRGLGYQCGFAGTNASDAMVQFQKTVQDQ